MVTHVIKTASREPSSSATLLRTEVLSIGFAMRYLFVLLSFLFYLSVSLPVGALPLPTLPAQDIDGKLLPDLRSGVVVFLLADKDRGDEAQRIGEDLAFGLRGASRLNVVSIINVSVVPSFLQGSIQPLIVQQIRTAETSLRNRFQAAGVPYTPPPGYVIPDWSGELTRAVLALSDRPEYALLARATRTLSRDQRTTIERRQQELRNHVHLFVVDNATGSIHHFVDAAEWPLARTLLGKLLDQRLANRPKTTHYW